MAISAQTVYQTNQITTATSQDLVLLLYGGGIKYLKLAINAIEQNQMEVAHNHLLRTQDVLTELELGLDMNVEIAHQLQALYIFMKEHLARANMKKDIGMIQETIELIEELRSTWKQAMEIAKKEAVKR